MVSYQLFDINDESKSLFTQPSKRIYKSKYFVWWICIILAISGIIIYISLTKLDPKAPLNTYYSSEKLVLPEKNSSVYTIGPYHKDLRLFTTYRNEKVEKLPNASMPSFDPPFDVPVNTSVLMMEMRKLISTRKKSTQGRTHRATLCAVIRNDINLLEYVVRHLVIGFSHIVFFDDNHVYDNIDYDMLPVLKPFIDMGLVTVTPADNQPGNNMDADVKEQISNRCLVEYGDSTDWVALLDTDEYFHVQPMKPTKCSKGELNCWIQNHQDTLGDFMDWLERDNQCGVYLKWRFMYGEGQVLFHRNRLLLDRFQRIGRTEKQRKLFLRPDRIRKSDFPLALPHGPLYCDRDGTILDESAIVYTEVGYVHKFTVNNRPMEVYLLHYFSRSLQEWLVKCDQFMPPYVRTVPFSYHVYPEGNCECKNINISPDFTFLVHLVMHVAQKLIYSFLRASNFDFVANFNFNSGLKAPLPILEITRNEYEADDYALYLFIKVRVLERMEFDHKKYWITNFGDERRDPQYVDGLHHFLATGFVNKVKSCWFNYDFPEISYCI